MNETLLHVLLLDDEASLREPLTRYLQDQVGYHVEPAQDGTEALELLAREQGNFNVALVDEVLDGELSGFDVLQYIKQNYPNIEVILFTSWGMEHALDALRAGAFRYLAKPFNREELAILVRHASEYQQLKGAARERSILEQLLETSAVLLGGQSEQETLDCILKSIQSIGFDRARLYLVSEDGQLMVARAHVGMDESFVGIQWPVADDVYMQILLADPRPHVFKRQEDQSVPFEELLSKASVQEWACVPLILQGRVIGKLSADNKYSCRPITDTELGPLTLFANQAAVTIANANLLRLTQQKLAETERQKQLLSALDRASREMRAEKEPSRLLHEIVHLAAELVGCRAGCLLINRPYLNELELVVAYGLPAGLVGSRLAHGTGLIGSVAQTGETKIVRDYAQWPEAESLFKPFHLTSAAAVPLKQTGDIEAVLFVADDRGQPKLSETDQEILQRFAIHASLAVETSRLIGREQRSYAQLSILHRISDYIIQATGDLDKIFHVVLTGVTASYGLGFNRAALLVFDDQDEILKSCLAIGPLDAQEARLDWEMYHKDGLDDFGRYLDLLEEGAMPLTTLGFRMKDFQLPLCKEDSDFFAQAVYEQRFILTGPEELDCLPASFCQIFEPESPCAIAPLIAQEKVIGVLVADNKFTRTPVTAEDINTLMTFANTAAIAIANTRLIEDIRTAEKRLRNLYQASSTLISSASPRQMLEDIVEHTRVVSEAGWVSMLLVDEMGRIRDLVTAGADTEPDPLNSIRPNGISMQVLRTGEAVAIHDTHKQRHLVNPSMFEHKVRSALCLPISLRGKRIGVMWIHYNLPRYFQQFEINDMELYVNHAALAYENARRTARLEQMRLAAEKLSGVTSLTEVLEQIVSSARAVFQADSTEVWSFDTLQGEFILKDARAHGIPADLWDRFQYELPRPGGSAYTIMERGWIGVEDLEALQRYEFLGESARDLLVQMGVKRFQGIALQVGDEKLAVLYVNYNTPQSFSEEDRETAQTFANHAALALKKAHLLEEVSRAKKAAQVVAHLMALGNVRATLISVVRGTKESLNCDAVVLFVYNQATKKLDHPPTMLGVNYPERATSMSEVTLDSIVYEMLTRDKPYFVESNTQDELFKNRRFTRDEGIESCVAIPLLAGGQKVGVMFVNYRRKHRFIEDELTNIRLFGHQAAVAIRNAQLYEQLQKRVAALLALNEAAHTVTSSLNLDEILPRIAEQAWQITKSKDIPISFATIRLVEGKKARIVAAYPEEELARSREKMGMDINLEPAPDRRTGITGRTIGTGITQRVGDVDNDPDYIQSHPSTRSEMVVPIKVGAEIIGVINVEHPLKWAFDQEDQLAMELLASQAAIAIQNARSYEREQKRSRTLESLYELSRAATGSLDLEEILISITEQAMRITGKNGKQAQYSLLALVDGKKLKFAAAYPPDALTVLLERVGEIDLKSSHIGVTGRAVLSGCSQLVGNVEQHPDYICHDPQTRSVLSVPIYVGDMVFGAINVEHPDYSAFDEEDQRALESLASHAGIAIHNAQMYRQEIERMEELRRANEELERTKNLAAARTSLAWMGMVSTTYWHAVSNRATTIQDLVKHARRELNAEASPEKLNERLSRIEEIAEKVRSMSITAPLKEEETELSLSINELLRERVRQVSKRDTYAPVKFKFEFGLNDSITVRASNHWLRRAFDILIENAVEAMCAAPLKQLTLRTRLAEGKVEINITDTGTGIPSDVLPLLFRRQVSKPKGARGLGMGLLMAHTIIQTYGGDIQVTSTGDSGTTMTVWLPAEE